MAGKTVTTITELVNALQDQDYWTNDAGTITVAPPNGILDFNNEGYFYKQTPFLVLPLPIPATPYAVTTEKDVTIDFNNTKLTNMYLYPGNVFMQMDTGHRIENTIDNTYTFLNGEFEAVLNDSAFLSFRNSFKYSNYENFGRSTLIFKNCIFNIKITNSNCVNIFSINCGRSYFINCVFNIEYVNMTRDDSHGNGNTLIYNYSHTNHAYQDYSRHYILSCEFRIRFRKGTLPGMSLDGTNNYAKYYIFRFVNEMYKEVSDNVVFANKYFTDSVYVGITHSATNTSTGNTKYTNNFVASFGSDEFNTKESLTIGNFLVGSSIGGTQLFYDNDKCGYTDYGTNTTKVGLPTADCKDAEKLIEAGYIFASES